MDEEKFAPFEQEPSACPFVALEDDRDRRSDAPDYRHRCFASPQPEPRAFPHQERYCLSRGFVSCPIFLDWARREAATPVPSRRSRAAAGGTAAAAGMASAAGAGMAASAAGPTGAASPSGPTGPGGTGLEADEPDDSDIDDEVGAPAFLAGRGRAASVQPPDAETVGDTQDGLWGPEKRAPRPGPVMATARPNRNRPDWEPVHREERYPRIRKQSSLRFVQPLLIAIVAVAVIAGLFLYLPGLLPKAGPAKPTGTPVAHTTPTPVPTITATPGPTFQAYTIKSGDTMTSIAAKFGISVDLLMAANPQVQSVDLIAAGDTLNIPWPGWTPSSHPSAAPQATGTKKP